MRTHIFLLLLCGMCFVATAQHSTKKPVQKPQLTRDIPQKVLDKFQAVYPKATVNGWYRENENQYKVIFRDPPTLQQLIVYDSSGKVIRKETELDTEEVPEGIRGFYQENYPDEKDYKVWVKQDGGKRTFYTMVDDSIVYFDQAGRFMHRESRRLKALPK